MLRNIVADLNTVCTSLKKAIKEMKPGQEVKVSITRKNGRDEWFVELSYPAEDAKKEK